MSIKSNSSRSYYDGPTTHLSASMRLYFFVTVKRDPERFTYRKLLQDELPELDLGLKNSRENIPFSFSPSLPLFLFFLDSLPPISLSISLSSFYFPSFPLSLLLLHNSSLPSFDSLRPFFLSPSHSVIPSHSPYHFPFILHSLPSLPTLLFSLDIISRKGQGNNRKTRSFFSS